MASSKAPNDVDVFLEELNSKRNQLRKNIEAIETQASGDDQHRSVAQDKIDSLIEEYNVLKKIIGDASLYLPSYHSKSAQDSLKLLWSQIDVRREASVPRKRFGFKKQAPTASSAEPVVNLVPTQSTGDEVDKAVQEETIGSFTGFKDLSNQTLTMNAAQVENEDLQLVNLSNCVVNLVGSPSTVHMKTIKNSTINVGPTKTSVFISDCSNCKFNISSQQLRIHSTTNSDFYVLTTSKAIIEDCQQLRFGVYKFNYDGIDEDFQKASIDPKTSFSADVVDFNWLSATHSPNWSAIS